MEPKEDATRMARPKKDPTARRAAQVNLRLSPAELDALNQKAEAAGMNLSAFTRAAALSRKLPTSRGPAVDFETRQELRRIGVNLNQIAKALNARRDALPASLSACCAKLDALFDRMLADGPEGHERRPQL